MATVTGMTAEYLETRLADKVDNDALSELVDDRVSALLVQGAGVTLDYDDTGNTLTVSASGGGSGISGITRCDSALTVVSTTMGGQPVRIISATSTSFSNLARGGVDGPDLTVSSSVAGDWSPDVAGWYKIRVRASLQWGAGGPDGLHWLIVTSSDDYNVIRPTLNDHPAYIGSETKAYRDDFFIDAYLEDGVSYDQQFSWNITTPGTVSPSYLGSGAIFFDVMKIG